MIIAFGFIYNVSLDYLPYTVMTPDMFMKSTNLFCFHLFIYLLMFWVFFLQKSIFAFVYYIFVITGGEVLKINWNTVVALEF